MKLNDKGMSIIETVLTFTLIMGIFFGMITIVMNYREKAILQLKKLELETFKNTITKDIQDDFLTRGVQEINDAGACAVIPDLSQCINILFQDGTEKAFGVGKVDTSSRSSMENKFLYYDGIKYPIHDPIPKTIPEGRQMEEFQSIKILDTELLSTDSAVLEDGKIIYIYSIDLYISDSNFSEDFGLHLVTSTLSIREEQQENVYLIQKNLATNFHATNLLGNGFHLVEKKNNLNHTVIQEAEHIIFQDQNTSATNNSVTYSSIYSIDLSAYQKMHIRYRTLSQLTNASGSANIWIGFQKQPVNNQSFAAFLKSTNATTVQQDSGWLEEEIDISSLQGRYYLSISTFTRLGNITGEVRDIWLTM